MAEITIVESDLKPALDKHPGNQAFRNALETTTNCHQLLGVIGKYIEFNSVFGSGVANLAGEIAIRKDLFREMPEIEFLCDRSTSVAARIYAASIDEFGGMHCGPTHRALAQATLRGIGQFFGYTQTEMADALVPTLQLTKAMEEVARGYLLFRGELTDYDLFSGIGFHIGSEHIADDEFNILEQFLVQEYSALMRSLKTMKVSIGGAIYHASYWISVHTTVEADHYALAMQAANLALEYYQGQSREKMKQAVLDGFSHFSDVQTEFMKSLNIHSD